MVLSNELAAPDAAVLSPDSTVWAGTEQVSCELDDEAVILNLADGIYYGLNSVAARVWSLIQRPKSVQAICDTIESEYDVPPERCARDVTGLLLQLEKWALVSIERVPPRA